MSSRVLDIPGPPDLHAGTIHVWHIRIADQLSHLQDCHDLLDSTEQQRAGLFAVEHKQHEFIITRALLRQLLSAYLGVGATELGLTAGKHGKLYLQTGFGPGNMHFNVSHSHGESLVALAVDHTVGIDIEKIRLDVEWQRLSERFFSPAESGQLNKLPVEQRIRAFFCCWTRKEAFVKALGDGIVFGLKEFDVDVTPEAETGLLRSCRNRSVGSGWHVRNIKVTDGFVAALAVNRPDADVRVWR